MKQLKSKNNAVLLVGLGLAILLSTSYPAQAQSTPAASVQAASGTDRLVNYYTTIARNTSANPRTGSDLKIYCLDTVFRKWADAYLKVLDRTALDVNDIPEPLNRFARAWFDSERNLRVGEFFRPGLSTGISETWEQLYSEGEAPEGLYPENISLDDIQDDLYVESLKFCTSDVYFNKLKAAINGVVDESLEIPSDIISAHMGQIFWIRTQNGGIAPRVKVDVAPASRLSISHPESKIIGGGLRYEEFVSQILMRF